MAGKFTPLPLAPPQTAPGSVVAIPKVSVAMITFNHEKYIAQAVESAMLQQTTFDYEVVVGEDGSTDNTRQILLELKSKYPDKLKLLLHPQNLGARGNFIQVLQACRGQYLAFLEGDDFWTSPQKLQTQVEALDNNPDWSVCTHRIEVFFEDKSQPSYLAPRFDPKPVSTLDDLAKASFVGTSAGVYRRIPVERYPAWVFDVGIIDYAHSLFYAQYGKIGFIDTVMCSYRKHNASLWFPRDSITQRTELARSLRLIAKHMAWRPRVGLESQAAQALLKIAKARLENGEVSQARQVMKEIMKMPYCIPGLPRRRFIKMILKVYFPWIPAGF